MRFHAVLALVAISWSCRDIQAPGGAAAIQGYQLDGQVTSSNGIPVEGVDVRLYYEYHYISDTPIDTVKVTVVDPAKPVDIAVYTPSYAFVRQLFLGYRQPGIVPRFTWDGYDAAGVPVLSGKYLIRYVVDTIIVKYSPVIADGHTTATTDAAGKFSITSKNLPVGDVFDLYDQYNRYAGTYEVMPRVDIAIRKGTSRATYTNISLIMNQISENVFILQ